MNGFVTPLRYPGGKRKLFKYTKQLLQANNLLGCSYIEPFAGGAGLALKLLDQGIVQQVYLNDLDRSIYSFWDAVLNDTEQLVDLIEKTSVTTDEWFRQKEIQQRKMDADDLELAFSTFFLNRTNRSGILKGGIIGGKNQNGINKLDCRYNKKNLIDRIYSIAAKSNNIHLFNMDAKEFVVMLGQTLPLDQPCFFFLDPPYYHKGPELYINFYEHQDHVDLANAVRDNVQHPWIVTYDNVGQIRDLYPEFHKTDYDLTYSAQNKQLGKEIMIYSDNLVPVAF